VIGLVRSHVKKSREDYSNSRRTLEVAGIPAQMITKEEGQEQQNKLLGSRIGLAASS
jgi:hypothetical protein